ADTDWPVRSCPPSVTLPLVALSWPEMRLKYVVLPAPLGPTMAVSVPGSKAQVTALTATWPPKRMVKSLVAKVLMGGASLSRSLFSLLERLKKLFGRRCCALSYLRTACGAAPSPNRCAELCEALWVRGPGTL